MQQWPFSPLDLILLVLLFSGCCYLRAEDKDDDTAMKSSNFL